MKYLSVIVFAVLLSSTWYIINSEAAVSLETHVGIQAKLAQLIIDTVKTKKPNATDVQVDQVWTEPFGSGRPIRVKAHFTYHFNENTSDSGNIGTAIQGQGLLEKKPDDGSGFDRWVLTDVKSNSDAVTFQQALVISTTATSDARVGGDTEPAVAPSAH